MKIERDFRPGPFGDGVIYEWRATIEGKVLCVSEHVRDRCTHGGPPMYAIERHAQEALLNAIGDELFGSRRA